MKPKSDDDRDENGYPAGIAVSGNGKADRSVKTGKSRFDHIIDSLLIAGIIALVTTSVVAWNTATKLEAAFSERNQFYDREIDRIGTIDERQDEQLRRHDERLNRLEQQRRDAQSDSQHR